MSEQDIEKQIADVQRRVQEMERFIENVRNLGAVSEFDAELWGLLVDKVVVNGKDDVRVEIRKFLLMKKRKAVLWDYLIKRKIMMKTQKIMFLKLFMGYQTF